MAHCGCLLKLSRGAQKVTSLLTTSGACSVRRLPALRCLSTTQVRLLQNDGKDEPHTNKKQDTSYQNEEYSSTSSSSSSSSESEDSSSESQRQIRDEEGEYEHTIKQRILQASLIHVHEFGWTKKALEAGAMTQGLPPIAQGMFPRGGAELVHYFYAKSNAELALILKHQVELREKEGIQKPSGKAFIRDALETRLRMIVPYLDTWSQAMATQALPANAIESWTNLLNLADEVWYYAGDRSVDFNWYTKRVALAAVYKSAEIYMLQDKSEDLQDTWDFLDRRLQDFQTFGSCKKKVEQNLDVVKEGLEASVTLARNILGMNSRNR